MRTTLPMLLLCLAACDDTVGGQVPVGGTVDTEAEVQRFLRRAYLDLSGKVPTDPELTDGTTRLLGAGNTVASRAALADELIAKAGFGKVWIEELENGIFGGSLLDQQYAFVCSLVRAMACTSCSAADPCTCTSCGLMSTLLAERTDLAKTAADLTAGQKTSSIERRYAAASGYFVLAGTPEGRVRTLFDDFLGRTAELDEVENGRGMIIGAIFPNMAAGLLFHRHGSTYADLIDIVFDSEVYREAIVRRVFDRYLARSPSSIELAHFASALDATEPDARDLLRDVVSSREYFEQ